MLGAILGRHVYPQPYRALAAPGPLPVERHAYGAERSQFADLRVPPADGPHPVVVLVHGGFWRPVFRADLMNALAVDLTRRGVATWNLEYRRAGMPGGGWPGTLRDVRAGIDLIAEVAGSLRLDTTRVAAVGHSAGGQLALWAASRRTAALDPPRVAVRSVVALAAVADLVEGARLGLGNGAVEALLGAGPEERAERYRQASPAALLPLGVPQLVVHGDRDEAVPQTMSVAYARAAAGAGDDVETLLLEGVAHAALIDPAGTHWPRVVAWLGERLGAAA